MHILCQKATFLETLASVGGSGIDLILLHFGNCFTVELF